MGISASAPWRAFYGNTPATLNYPHKTMYELVAAAGGAISRPGLNNRLRRLVQLAEEAKE